MQSKTQLSFAGRIGLICSICLLFASPVLAQPALDNVPDATRTYVIENVRIVQAPGRVIENGTIIIRDGLIHSVGASAALPFDAKVMEGDSLTVYAGFIDGLSNTGIPKPKAASNLPSVPRANPPNDRAGIQPERFAADMLDHDDKSISQLREVGFTAAHVVPHGQMLPGSGAIILLGGDSPKDLVVVRDASMFAQIVGARGVYPGTPMGVMAKFRQLYYEAQRRNRIENLYDSDPSGIERPAYDPVHGAFFPVLAENKPVVMFANDPLSAYRSMRLQGELNFPLVLAGLYEGFEIVDQLMDADVPLFLSLKMPKDPKKGDDADSLVYDPELRVRTFADAEAEANNLKARQKLVRNQFYETAANLHEASLPFGFTTMDVKPADIHKNLRKMVEHGLPTDAALAGLTTVPAETFGLSRSMGTVDAGKLANLVVTTGDLFDEDTKIRYVFVEGKPHEYDVAEKKSSSSDSTAAGVNPIGEWTFEIEGVGVGGLMTIEGEVDDMSGTMEVDGQPGISVDNLVLDGDELTFSISVPGQGTVTGSVTIDGDEMEGSLEIPGMGSAPIVAERNPESGFFQLLNR